MCVSDELNTFSSKQNELITGVSAVDYATTNPLNYHLTQAKCLLNPWFSKLELTN